MTGLTTLFEPAGNRDGVTAISMGTLKLNFKTPASKANSEDLYDNGTRTVYVSPYDQGYNISKTYVQQKMVNLNVDVWRGPGCGRG